MYTLHNPNVIISTKNGDEANTNELTRSSKTHPKYLQERSTEQNKICQ